MKKTLTKALSVAVSLLLLICLVACNTVPPEGLWENATYRKDVTLGTGEKTVSFTVEAGEEIITVTLKTDKETLGEAMYEHELVNDASFFDTLNGIKADWNADKAYWSFYQGESYMTVGISDTVINGGEQYRFVYTK